MDKVREHPFFLRIVEARQRDYSFFLYSPGEISIGSESEGSRKLSNPSINSGLTNSKCCVHHKWAFSRSGDDSERPMHRIPTYLEPRSPCDRNIGLSVTKLCSVSMSLRTLYMRAAIAPDHEFLKVGSLVSLIILVNREFSIRESEIHRN